MGRLLITALFTFAFVWVVSDANSVRTEHHESSASRRHKRSVEETAGRGVCESQECQDLSRLLKDSMNDTIDPCTNFYLYACGNWMEHNPLPEGLTTWNMLSMLQTYVSNKTAGILNEENKPDDLLPLKMARKLYKSCMDLEDMERRGLEPLVMTIARGGGMPMILDKDEFDEDHMTWQRVDDYYIYLTGELSFIDISIRPSDESESAIYLPYLALPGMPVGSFLLREGEGAAERRQKYHEFVTKVAVDVAKARGFPVTAESISEDVDDLIDFIAELEALRDFSTSETNMTLREFQEWYDGLGHTSKTSQIDWIHKITMLFDNGNVELDDNSLVRVLEMMYIKELAALLDRTAPRTLVNYVHWRIGSHSLNATTQEMMKIVDNLGDSNSHITADNGNDEEKGGNAEELRKGRENYCSQQMEMSSTLDFEYVRRHTDEETIETVKEMVDNIRAEIATQILQSEWMDENTKAYALLKVAAMDSIIGYPKWYENKTTVNSFYKGLIISPSYYENVINHAKRKNWKKLSLVMKTVKEVMLKDDNVEPTTVNAFYMPTKNLIAITAADLQSPVYHTSRPVMVNYGMLGLIIGHEINHAFDSDNFGDKFPGVEPDNILTDAYGARAGCFVEQYANYAIDLGWFNGTNAYGNQTSGENIADGMGLIAGFNAYKKLELEKGRPEPTLPGFETFTNNQLFFLSYANVWCEYLDLDTIKKESRSDVHSPGFMRVIGTLSNSEAFADAFNCPQGSPMNPEKKCNIWK